MTKETIKILRDDTFISPRLKIAGTTLSPFGKQLTSNLVINPIGQYSLLSCSLYPKDKFLSRMDSAIIPTPLKDIPFLFFTNLDVPVCLSAGFRSLLTFLPPLRPCLPAFPSPSRGSNKSRPSGTFIIRAEKRWAKIQRRRETGGNLLLLLLGENLSRRR